MAPGRGNWSEPDIFPSIVAPTLGHSGAPGWSRCIHSDPHEPESADGRPSSASQCLLLAPGQEFARTRNLAQSWRLATRMFILCQLCADVLNGVC